MYQVQYLKPKKKGYAKHTATFMKIDDAVFWEKVMTEQDVLTSKSWLSKLSPLNCHYSVSTTTWNATLTNNKSKNLSTLIMLNKTLLI